MSQWPDITIAFRTSPGWWVDNIYGFKVERSHFIRGTPKPQDVGKFVGVGLYPQIYRLRISTSPRISPEIYARVAGVTRLFCERWLHFDVISMSRHHCPSA